MRNGSKFSNFKIPNFLNKFGFESLIKMRLNTLANRLSTLANFWTLIAKRLVSETTCYRIEQSLPVQNHEIGAAHFGWN